MLPTASLLTAMTTPKAGGAWPSGQGSAASSSRIASAGQDNVHISDKARALSKGVSRTLLSTVTDMGSQISVEARSAGGSGLSMGRASFAGGVGSFSLSGQGQEGGKASVEYAVSITHADGSTQAFEVKDSLRLYQQADGTVLSREGAGEDDYSGQSIVINVADGAQVKGGKGSDLVLNTGLGAQIDAQGGHDSIISMGDGTTIDGGTGDDAITVLEDVLQRSLAEESAEAAQATVSTLTIKAGGAADKDIFSEGDEYVGEDGKFRRPRGSQSVTVNGGQGDDDIMVRAALFEGHITGGDGSDNIETGDIIQSKVDAGAHDDTLLMRNVIASTVMGGSGDDSITARLVKDSIVMAGSGNDRMEITAAQNSMLMGGEGDDIIKVGELHDSFVDGGDGKDTITLNRALGSLIQGGDGDDTILVQGGDDGRGGWLQNSVIKGNDGNDTITVNTGKDGLVQNSVIKGNDGDDIITVTTGKMQYGTANSDGPQALIQGNAGNDIIRVNVNTMTVFPHRQQQNGAASDGPQALIQGNAGDDVIDVQVGSMVFPRGSAGTPDLVDGGSGTNRVQVSVGEGGYMADGKLVSSVLREGSGARLWQMFAVSGQQG